MENELYQVKTPILGFETINEVTLTQIDDTFAQIHSHPDAHTSFTLVNPYVLRSYQFDIPIATQTLLEINSETNLLLYNIVVVQNPIHDSTVNFVAPILFNTDNKTMSQIILDGSKHPEYGIAEPISSFMQTEEEAPTNDA
jgi:flagellar assembly factor FliW